MGVALALALALVMALCRVRAVTYGEPGVGSQYQLFGRPITDTTATHSRTGGSIAALPVAVPTHTQALAVAVEGDAQQTGGGAAKAAANVNANAKQKCEGNYQFSEVFGKCLPAPGTDGYIGAAAAEHDKEKAKGKAESAFVPIESADANVLRPLPLQSIPIEPLRAPVQVQPLNREPPQPQPQPTQPQPQPTQPPAQTPAPTPRQQQLRLACPMGFTFQPAVGACIAPASMFAPQQQLQHQAMRRGGEDTGDSDASDDDALRRELMMRARHRLHRRMFGRRFGSGFGGPRILAPVFVFVLPPQSLDRNATMRLGQHFARVHEVHPSLVGGGTRTAPGTGAGGEAIAKPAEQPIAQPAGEPAKPKGPTGTGTGAGEEPPKALRGAFVNPIVTSGGVGKAQPQPLMRVDGDGSGALQRRAQFVSPFVTQHTAADV